MLLRDSQFLVPEENKYPSIMESIFLHGHYTEFHLCIVRELQVYLAWYRPETFMIQEYDR